MAFACIKHSDSSPKKKFTQTYTITHSYNRLTGGNELKQLKQNGGMLREIEVLVKEIVLRRRTIRLWQRTRRIE